MIGGFVQQQNVRSLNQRFDDGQTLLPASRQCNRRGFKLVEAGAAKGFREASAPLGGRNGGSLQRFLEYRANRVSRRKFRILQNTGEPDTLANRDVAAIHIFVARQNSKQRGFARTVWTDQSNPVALGNGEGDIVEEHGRSKRLGDALCIDDRRQRLVPCFLLSCNDLVDLVGFEPTTSSMPFLIFDSTGATQTKPE